MFKRIVIGFVACLSISAVSDGSLLLAQTPSEIVRAFHAALTAGDSAAALSLLDPEVKIFEAGGMESSRNEYRSHHLGADMAFAENVARDVTVVDAGESGDIAWVLAAISTAGAFRGREIDTRGTETMILRKNGGGWQIIHIHWSSRSQ
jgi:ketosteroid isomerase-like protein